MSSSLVFGIPGAASIRLPTQVPQPVSCITAGIANPNPHLSFSLFPNPCSSETTLTTTQDLFGATITVYNAYGQAVKQIKDIYGQTTVLQRKNLSTGIYFIQLSQDDITFSVDKLVITNH